MSTVAHIGPIHPTPDTSASWVHDRELVASVLEGFTPEQRRRFLRYWAAGYRGSPRKPADVSAYRWSVDHPGRHRGSPDPDWMGSVAGPGRQRAPTLDELDADVSVPDLWLHV